MNKQTEALKLALEALDHNLLFTSLMPGYDGRIIEKAYKAINKALAEQPAQPQQEPVAWICEGSASDEKHAVDYQQEDIDAIQVGTMLYTTPPQRKPLTHEQRVDLLAKFEPHKHEWHAPAILIDMVEAAHGIKGEA